MKDIDQMKPEEVLWHQYDVFNYPSAEEMHNKHCKKGNKAWPSFDLETWESALRKVNRQAKEMDLDTATRLLTEPQSLIRPVKRGDENNTTDKVRVVRYDNGLMDAIDHANQHLNLNERNELMRYVCDASGIPNLQSLRTYMKILRDGQ